MIRAAFDVIAIGGEPDGTAVAAAGGRIAAHVGWAEAPGALAAIAGRPVLLVEAEGIGCQPGSEAHDAAFAAIAGAMAARDCPAVVALGRDSIDPVARHLLDGPVQLLCDPSGAERAAALVVAARWRDGGLLSGMSGGVREDDTARLDRMTREVARIADMLAALAKEGTPPEGPPAFLPPPDPDAPDIDAATIRRIVRARRLRDRFFGAGLFEDPAWDMMLDLFAASLERAEVSVSSLCIAAAVAPTTALRWIGRMTAAGLFERKPDPFDGRRALVSLSDRALAAMRGYFAALHAGGLPLA